MVARGAAIADRFTPRARERAMKPTLYWTGLAILVCLAPAVGAADPAPGAPGLTLESAVENSLTVGEDVRIARARRDQAEAGVGKARSALLPDLDATGAYTRRRSIDNRDDNALAAEVTVSSTVFDARALPLLRAAKRARDAAALDEQDQRRQTAFAAAEAFLVALGQERIVLAANEHRDFALARRREVAARVEAQLTSRNDQTQVELELATADRELTAANVALADAYTQLAFWVGAPVAGPLVEPTWLYDRASAPAADPGGVTGRPDLAAAKLRVESAAEAAKEPARRIWPTIGVFGQVRFANDPGLPQHTDWAVGVTATWSIWDGGARAADERTARATTEIARLQASIAERRATTEVDSAMVRLRGAQADVTAATTLAEVASRNASEVAILYSQGLVRALEVTDAGSQQFDANVALVRARIGVAAAYLDLVAATGGQPVPAGGVK
jgi:outer membrane protein TolC